MSGHVHFEFVNIWYEDVSETRKQHSNAKNIMANPYIHTFFCALDHASFSKLQHSHSRIHQLFHDGSQRVNKFRQATSPFNVTHSF